MKLLVFNAGRQVFLISLLFSLLPTWCFTIHAKRPLRSTNFFDQYGIRKFNLFLQSATSSILEQVKDEIVIQVDKIVVERPLIHYTVPGYKRGWRDENGNWFDEDGLRNGPPMNFWRQSLDERAYNQDMDTVSDVLTINDDDFKSVIENLERNNRVKNPSLSRKVLGQWALLIRCGEKVANYCNSNDGLIEGSDDTLTELIEVPMTVDIFRSNGRLLAEKTAYGVFDKKLEQGEELTIYARGDKMDDKKYTLSAYKNNENCYLGEIGGKSFYFGGITYLSDYLMITRGDDGEIDFWLRSDDSYLGVS